MLLRSILILFLLNSILLVFGPKFLNKKDLQTQLKIYMLSAMLDIVLAIIFYFIYIFTT